MHRTKRLLYGLLLFGFGCTPFESTFIPKLTNENPKGPWRKGRQIYADTIDKLVSFAQYNFHTVDHLVFEVGFFNAGDKPVLVDPDRFYSQSMALVNKVKDTTGLRKKKEIFRPAQVIAMSNAAVDKEISDYNSMTTMHSIGIFLDLLSALTLRETAAEEDSRRTRMNTDQLVHRSDQEWQLERIEEATLHTRKLEDDLLQKTTLFPGEKIGGMVFFNRHNKAVKIQFTLPVEDKTFTYQFSHQLENPQKRP